MTTTKTYLLDSSAEAITASDTTTAFRNITGANTTASFASAISDADASGSAGYILHRCLTTVSTARNNNNLFQIYGTFEDLGVPTGSLLTAIQISYSYAIGTMSTGSTATPGKVEYFSGLNTTVGAAGGTQLIAAQAQKTTSSSGVWTRVNSGTVSLSNIASSTAITLRFNNNLTVTAVSNNEANILYDYIVITLDYTQPVTGSSGGSSNVSPASLAPISWALDSSSKAIGVSTPTGILSRFSERQTQLSLRRDNLSQARRPGNALRPPTIEPTDRIGLRGRSNSNLGNANQSRSETRLIYSDGTFALRKSTNQESILRYLSPQESLSSVLRSNVETIIVVDNPASTLSVTGLVIKQGLTSYAEYAKTQSLTPPSPKQASRITVVTARATAIAIEPRQSILNTTNLVVAEANSASFETTHALYLRGPPAEVLAEAVVPLVREVENIIALPISDITTGSWTPVPLYAQLDDFLTEDLDYAVSTTNAAGDAFEVLLAPISSTRKDCRIVYRAYAVNSHNASVTVTLLDGSTPIASWTDNLITFPDPIPDFTQHFLTQEQANAITSFNDLRLRFEATI